MNIYPASNRNVIQRICASDRNILDIGCGSGGNARSIKHLYPECRVVGISYNQKELELAADVLDDSLLFDLNSNDLPTLSDEYDLIIFSHVLEHLVDPQHVVSHFSRFSTSNGRLIIVLPNIAHFRSRLRLLWGKFEYENTGLFDHTHLRFFTYDSLYNFFSNGGYLIRERFASGHLPLPGLRSILPCKIAEAADKLFLRIWPNLLSNEIGLVMSKV